LVLYHDIPKGIPAENYCYGSYYTLYIVSGPNPTKHFYSLIIITIIIIVIGIVIIIIGMINSWWTPFRPIFLADTLLQFIDKEPIQ